MYKSISNYNFFLLKSHEQDIPLYRVQFGSAKQVTKYPRSTQKTKKYNGLGVLVQNSMLP